MSVATALSRDAAAALRTTATAVRDATAADAVDGIAPGLVASPTNTDQVAEVLRICAHHRLAVVARGGGTKISWGSPPLRLDLLLDVSGLDRVVEHAAGDLIAVAGAGVRIAELNRVLGLAGQQLAVDETVAGATVGGTICAGASGPQRLLRGTVRDLLIGLTFVRSDGKVVHAGGRVVKNVAGYDVCKLLVGSAGTLGVVTEAVFRLHPLPAARRVVTMACDRPEDAGALVARIVHGQTVPSAVEIDCPDDGQLVVAALLEGSPDPATSSARSPTRCPSGGAATRGRRPTLLSSSPSASAGSPASSRAAPPPGRMARRRCRCVDRPAPASSTPRHTRRIPPSI